MDVDEGGREVGGEICPAGEAKVVSEEFEEGRREFRSLVLPVESDKNVVSWVSRGGSLSTEINKEG